MSIEMRFLTEGECTCGVPYPTDNPPPPHNHRLVCDWGEDQRLFLHMEHDTGRWTWELFPAHFEDGQGPDDMFIGRWPD